MLCIYIYIDRRIYQEYTGTLQAFEILGISRATKVWPAAGSALVQVKIEQLDQDWSLGKLPLHSPIAEFLIYSNIYY